MLSLVSLRSVCHSSVGVRFVGLVCSGIFFVAAANGSSAAENDAKKAPPAEVAGLAKTAAEMKPYLEQIKDSDAEFEMLPIPGGKFKMGSPTSEEKRGEDEGPQHEVEIAPFWMGKYEVTWDEYEVFMFQLDIARRKLDNREPTAAEKIADACSKPTKPYTDMTFGMGKDRFPVICMTQYSAMKYCEWISKKTGRYYRLPTEAEWEYACRAGSTTPYSFGEDASQIGDYAWYYDNSDGKYHEVGKKKPNQWGLYDMHGNVAEWTFDQYDPTFYAKSPAKNPVNSPKKSEPCPVRGGSWDDDPEALRSAVRMPSTTEWKQQDPQIPQSIWYYTDALFVGFRVVRPLEEPSAEVKAKVYAPGPPQ
ncbi:MAG: formylglycine-generating enzyme family protein [Planctomycetia bacterium]|nr:formylglycine-generating enzyme family protein [Planctomycetia bacterium]